MFAIGRPNPRLLSERERRHRTHRPRQTSPVPPPSPVRSSFPRLPSQTSPGDRNRTRIFLFFPDGRRIEIARKPSKETKQPWKSFDNLPTWNLIPKEKFTHLQNYFLFKFDCDGFVSRYCRLHQRTVPFKHSKRHPAFEERWQHMNEEVEQKYRLNQQLRWAFKTLATRWLERKLQFKNTTDFATLEVPKNKVVLYDWSQRSKYALEASSILGDFRTRLLSHEELFPMPLHLRNPFTNSLLSYAQIHSLYMQLRSLGKTHWTLECFRDAEYDIYYFKRDNQRKLRLMALKHLLETNDCRFLLLDFIENQHIVLNKPCDTTLYDWAITCSKACTLKRIQSWKEMCYKYYEIDITTEDIDEKTRKQEVISRMSEPLCTPCEELKMVRQMIRNKRRQA